VFLAEASEVLASSLDYRATLASVARLAVPTLADWCAVDVLGEDGSLERLAVEHQDPEKIRLAHELEERYPADPDAPRGVHQVLRTGEPEMMSEIPEELLDQAARDEEHREMIKELGLKSYIVVPLMARGKALGRSLWFRPSPGGGTGKRTSGWRRTWPAAPPWRWITPVSIRRSVHQGTSFGRSSGGSQTG
jgi:GAF domain-containing protein